MLTLKDKENIYDLLVLNFPKEKKIPLSKLALYLKDKGFSYEEHGYKKLRPLLEDLNFLSLENSAPGSSDVFVTLHDFTWKEDSSSAEEEMPTLRLKPVKGYEERKDSFAPKKKNVPAHKPALKEEKKNCPKKYGWDRPDFVEQIGKRQVRTKPSKESFEESSKKKNRYQDSISDPDLFDKEEIPFLFFAFSYWISSWIYTKYSC